MMKTALVDCWTCDFGDGICHKWTVGKNYDITRHTTKEKIDDKEVEIVTYTISSDAGVSENVPVEIINKDMMKDTFGMEI